MSSDFTPSDAGAFDRHEQDRIRADGDLGGAMRFEPRVVGRPEEIGDLPVPDQWPADLEALAEQLAADAEFLAERYPAAAARVTTAAGKSVADVAVVATPSRQLPRWLRSAAAAVVLLAIGGTIAGYRLQNNPSDSTPATAVRPVPASDSVQAVVLPVDFPAIAPAVGFHELTPPEQEAVLDLMEGDSEPVLLSI